MSAFPSSLQYPGLGDTITDAVQELSPRDAFLRNQMHALAIAINQAKMRGDKADMAALLVRFEALAREFAANNPNQMGAVDNFILAVGTYIESSIDAIPDAISKLPQQVGLGIFKAALPFAALYLGYLWLGKQR